jgi:hypothetical protein
MPALCASANQEVSMKVMLFGLVMLASSIVPTGFALAGQAKAGAFTRWEYRILTKDQVLDLGNKDLTAGLDKLGDDGWELAAVDSAYIFKRPKSPTQNAQEIKQRFAIAEAEVEQWKEHLAWSMRMAKKGFIAEQKVDADRAKLQAAEVVLESARRELEASSKDAKERFEKLPMPK